MAAYDSDSSGEGEGEVDYTETSVLLGYAAAEPTDDIFSQLGGHPTWLNDDQTPPASLARCQVCNGLLTLLLQLNGDLPDRFPGHDRRLYLFSCRKKACRRKGGSVRGVRGSRVTRAQVARVQKEEARSSNEPAPQLNIGGALFGSAGASSASANPFSPNPFSAPASANPFASVSTLAAQPARRPDSAASLPETFASKARISDSSPSDHASSGPTHVLRPHEPWPSLSDFPPPYPKSHLDADYETLSAPSTPQVPRVTPDMDTGMDTDMDSGSAEGGHLLESTMDKTFQKFADQLAQNPEQILRYEFGGQPLLYSTTDDVGTLLSPRAEHAGKISTVSSGGSMLPRCTNCGSHRAFELQLTPHAITVLEEEEPGLDGMDWGTVIVAVCSKDCAPSGIKEGEVGYLEEWVGVQWEELDERRRRQ